MQFGPLNLDPNILIFVVLGAFFVLAFLFGETRIRRISLALLAGLFVADQLTNFSQTQLSSTAVGRIDELTLKVVLLLVVLVPLSLGKAPSVGGHFSIRSMVLSLLTAATLLAYIFSYLPSGAQTELSNSYNLAAIALDNRAWWLSGLIFWMVLLQVWKKKAKEDDSGSGKGKGKKKKR